MAFTIIPPSGSSPARFEGTDGSDAISINSTNTFILTGQGGNDVVNSGTSVDNSLVSLGDGDDIFTGNIAGGGTITASRINGNAGNDTIGNPGVGLSVTISNPTVVNSGGTGSGILGGQGDDVVYVTFMQSSRVNGNLGNDTIIVGVPGGVPTNVSDSEIFGGQGDDVVNATEGLTTSYFNTVIGGNLGDDAVTLATAGTVENVDVEGGDGNDTLTVIGGADVDGDGFITVAPLEFATFNADVNVNGGTGDDTINISLVDFGTLTVNGGDGDDMIMATDNFSGLTLNGEDGNDTISGGFGSDTITGGEGDDVLSGNGGNDSIDAGEGNNILFGGSGDDSLTAGAGDDQLSGGSGSDTLSGGAGNNVFFQGAGSTGVVTDNAGVLYGNGESFFIAGGADVITDWSLAAVNQLNTGSSGLAANADADLSLGFFTFGAGVRNVALRGDYNGAGVFTISSAGDDIGVVTQNGGGGYLDNFTVLDGAGGITLNAADFVV